MTAPESRIKPENLAGLYREAAARFGTLPAFATRSKDGIFHPISFAEIYEQGLALATALIDLGMEAREHVGLLSDNRLEWIICDYGVILAGGADVPRGSDVTDADIKYILTHADTRVVFVENPTLLAKVQQCHLPDVRHLILMDGNPPATGSVRTLASMIARGRALRDAGDRRAEERIAAIKPADLFTLIYTSGTTGTPKGVQLTHANMAAQIRNLPLLIAPNGRNLSILPVWHSYERVFEMISVSAGMCTFYTSIRTIGEDLKTVKPTFMASAPRLWENLYLKIYASVATSSPVKRKLFALAYDCARRVKRAQQFLKGQELDTQGRGSVESLRLLIRHLLNIVIFTIPLKVLDPLVLKKLRAVVGGEFLGTISGGGALQPHVDEFFNFIGIPVLEGYGLTETAPVLAVRTWDNLVIGTVGPLYPETELRIVELETGRVLYPDAHTHGKGRGKRGEIHVRGPQVMRGYYKDPGATAKVLNDGWLNTGDIGMITFNDCLKILGRSKDTIVLLSGENVEPVPIESRLGQSSFIDQCMVVGQDQKFLGVLIVPALDAFRTAGINVDSASELHTHSVARSMIDGEIRRLISAETGFKTFERIVAWRFLPKSFEIGDEMTATLKIRRHIISVKYAETLAGMYR